MKKILIMAAFTLCIGTLYSNTANALACNLEGCASSINGDAGVTSKSCNSPSGAGDGCACTALSTACTVQLASVCTGTWSFFDNHLDGRKCCVKNCSKDSPALIGRPVVETVESTTSEELNEVFETNMDGRAAEYYGYVNGANRSPENGRGNSAQAKLDACLFYTDVDAIPGADNAEKWTNCVGNTYGCGNTTNKNEYCQATGTNDGVSVSAAVCKDRCDCVYGQGTCAGL